MTRITIEEHEHEPVPGMPGELPEGEYILWQGRPSARLVARRVMHSRWIAGYFVVLAAWAILAGMDDGRSAGSIAFSVGGLMALGAAMLGLIELYGWAVHKTTLYTLTNARLVMRIGVGLTVILNLPLSRITSAALKLENDGSGNIALSLRDQPRLALMVIWPHSRPWHWSNPEPSMICLPKAGPVAEMLAGELQRLNRHGVSRAAGHVQGGKKATSPVLHGEPVTG